MNSQPLPAGHSRLQPEGLLAAESVSGPSFPTTVKALASALMLALVFSGASVLQGPSVEQAREIASSQWVLLLAVVAVIVSGYWGILTSRTTCDARSIEQSWLWRKNVAIADITQVKLIRFRGLEWLIVPRLVVRTGVGLTTFHAADPAVLERFQLLVKGR